jgi:hypothetical protein
LHKRFLLILSYFNVIGRKHLFFKGGISYIKIMGNNVANFNGVTRQSDGIFIHISELLVNRYRLNLSPLGILPETVESPHGHVATIPPTIEQADEAISFGLSDAAETVIQELYEAHIPKPVVLPKTVERDGVAHMVSDKALTMVNMHQDARFALVVEGIMGAVHESLDQQFPFLRLINGEELAEKVSFVPFLQSEKGVVESDITPNLHMARELYESCLSIARKHNGSDWALLKTDHNLANRIQASVGVYTKAFGYEL